MVSTYTADVRNSLNYFKAEVFVAEIAHIVNKEELVDMSRHFFPNYKVKYIGRVLDTFIFGCLSWIHSRAKQIHDWSTVVVVTKRYDKAMVMRIFKLV